MCRAATAWPAACILCHSTVEIRKKWQITETLLLCPDKKSLSILPRPSLHLSCLQGRSSLSLAQVQGDGLTKTFGNPWSTVKYHAASESKSSCFVTQVQIPHHPVCVLFPAVYGFSRALVEERMQWPEVVLSQAKPSVKCVCLKSSPLLIYCKSLWLWLWVRVACCESQMWLCMLCPLSHACTHTQMCFVWLICCHVNSHMWELETSA